MSIMQQFGYPSPGTAKGALLQALRESGASRLEAHYSGGNDEGGVDGLKLLDADGKEFEVPNRGTYRPPREGERGWGPQGQVYEEHPLWQAADEMLSTEYGSWAGEFSAYGTLYADLKENRVWREGSVQSGYDDDSKEY